MRDSLKSSAEQNTTELNCQNQSVCMKGKAQLVHTTEVELWIDIN